jgi:hypothetical protein
MQFSYDATVDTNSSTLDVLLRGCGLLSGYVGFGVTFNMTITGKTRIFGIFNKHWTEAGVTGLLECDQPLKDAVHTMGQLRGTKLVS